MLDITEILIYFSNAHFEIIFIFILSKYLFKSTQLIESDV